MRVLRSGGQPELSYVLLTDDEIVTLRADLRKAKSPFAKALRKALKTVLR